MKAAENLLCLGCSRGSEQLNARKEAWGGSLILWSLAWVAQRLGNVFDQGSNKESEQDDT